MSSGSSSTQQLSREAEGTRTALVHTLSELSGKVGTSIDQVTGALSPSNIKAEVKGYVREESSHIVSSLKRQASENPLQAVAIGAAVLYPFWGLLKSIPVPVLLIGGGLWLTKQNGSDASRKISDSVGDAAQSAKDAASSVGADLHAFADTVGDTAQGVVDSTVSAASAAAASIKEASQEAMETASSTISDLGERGAQAAEQTRTAFDELMYKNPLLVGGIALGIGALIAASLPGSRTEDNLFGKSSGQIKDKALDAVNQGVERAKDAAADIVGDVAAAAAREGLSRDGVSRTIEGTAGAIKSVVDKGLTTALGDDAGQAASTRARTSLN